MMHTDNMRELLQNAERIRTIDRYLSGVAEALSFFRTARQELDCRENHSLTHCNGQVKAYARLEASKAIEKVSYTQKVCRDYIDRSHELVQLVCLENLNVESNYR